MAALGGPFWGASQGGSSARRSPAQINYLFSFALLVMMRVARASCQLSEPSRARGGQHLELGDIFHSRAADAAHNNDRAERNNFSSSARQLVSFGAIGSRAIRPDSG